jgi:hypothetical protein
MKKRISLILALALCLALGVPAWAAGTEAVLSPQHLVSDGVAVECEKYNINGSNYFKLRDIAALLAYTPAAFGISFNAETNTVLVERGGVYERLGTELVTGKDNSDTCVPSTWKLVVDGAPVSVSTYNIGGSNFYKLRDMGDALGFSVDYNAETNTAIIYSDAGSTATTTSQTPFVEAKGIKLTEPWEHQPTMTRYLSDSAGIIDDKGVTVSAPVITRTTAWTGYVTYRITYDLSGYAECKPPKNAETIGTVFETYGLYDYYTGARIPTQITAKSKAVIKTDTTVSFRGKAYPLTSQMIERDDSYVEKTYSSAILRTDMKYEIEVTAPENYDGLMLAMRCNDTKVLYEPLPEISRGKEKVSYFNDFGNLGNWVFVRVSDWAK